MLSRKKVFHCLVRKDSNTQWLIENKIPLVVGDLNDPASLLGIFGRYSALVNVASIGFGAAPSIVSACLATGIRRAVFVGTTAIFTTLNTTSKGSRTAAEVAIRSSGLDFTLLRPTMIYGTPADRNMVRLLRLIKWSPVVPVFGNGKSLQQPVHAEDVAWAICEALDSPSAVGKEYNISGRSPLDFNDVIHAAAIALGRRPLVIHLPATPIVYLLRILERCRVRLPIKSEQILRLNEDKSFHYDDARRDFGYQPRDFSTGIESEIMLLHAGVAFPK
jgi:nucleoside-diphosphate-sugar epimerase